MTLVLWHPGTSVSTADVAHGLGAGLQALGHHVINYPTDVHLEVAGGYLRQAWRRIRRVQDVPRPTSADLIYWASKGILETALRAWLEHDARWVIVISGMYQHPDFVLMLRRAGLRVAVVLTESPYELDDEVRFGRHADLVFTCERSSVSPLRNAGLDAHYLPHAWHPDLAQWPQTVEAGRGHDVIFVGTGFIERIAWLEAMDWTGIDLGLYGYWSLLRRTSPLRERVRGAETPQREAWALVRRSALSLNLHRTSRKYGRRTTHVTHAESLNPRIYELAALRVPFVTDWRAEVAERFGAAAAVARNPEEMTAIVRRLLADPEERAWRVEACAHAVAGHDWIARARDVVECLQAHDAQQAA